MHRVQTENHKCQAMELLTFGIKIDILCVCTYSAKYYLKKFKPRHRPCFVAHDKQKWALDIWTVHIDQGLALVPAPINPLSWLFEAGSRLLIGGTFDLGTFWRALAILGVVWMISVQVYAGIVCCIWIRTRQAG